MRVAVSGVSLLARFRRHRLLGVGFFVAFTLLVGVERRLAEMHHDLRSAGPGLESVDSLDGDEIRVRLIILNDSHPAALPAAAGGVVFVAVPRSVEQPSFELVGRPEPRAPPAHRSSAA